MLKNTSHYANIKVVFRHEGTQSENTNKLACNTELGNFEEFLIHIQETISSCFSSLISARWSLQILELKKKKKKKVQRNLGQLNLNTKKQNYNISTTL